MIPSPIATPPPINTITNKYTIIFNNSPSVGLIICKSTDKTIVEWSLKDIHKPLGIATYQLQEVVDRTVAELELRAKRDKEGKI